MLTQGLCPSLPGCRTPRRSADLILPTVSSIEPRPHTHHSGAARGLTGGSLRGAVYYDRRRAHWAPGARINDVINAMRPLGIFATHHLPRPWWTILGVVGTRTLAKPKQRRQCCPIVPAYATLTAYAQCKRLAYSPSSRLVICVALWGKVTSL